jgi:hypothetical protein
MSNWQFILAFISDLQPITEIVAGIALILLISFIRIPHKYRVEGPKYEQPETLQEMP